MIKASPPAVKFEGDFSFKGKKEFFILLLVGAVLRFGYMVVNETIGIDTDIDYHIYTEASAELLNPESGNPYNRYTYRYTPLLAYAMIPNLYWMLFGKVLFNVLDLVAIFYMKLYMNQFSSLSGKQANSILKFWIFNFYMIYINGRGSCESVSLVFLAATLYHLRKFRVGGDVSNFHLLSGAFFYGMLVHFRLYPIVFGLSVVFYITRGSLIPNANLIKFFIVSGGLFLGLFGLFRALYGDLFSYEYAFYHLGRKDPRHS